MTIPAGSDPNLEFPSSAAYDSLNLTDGFGPTYVAWTAPAAGSASVNMLAYDQYVNNTITDADPGFYVITSTAGPTAPIFSAPNYTLSGSQYQTSNLSVSPSTTIAGSNITDISGSNPLGTGAHLRIAMDERQLCRFGRRNDLFHRRSASRPVSDAR